MAALLYPMCNFNVRVLLGYYSSACHVDNGSILGFAVFENLSFKVRNQIIFLHLDTGLQRLCLQQHFNKIVKKFYMYMYSRLFKHSVVSNASHLILFISTYQ